MTAIDSQGNIEEFSIPCLPDNEELEPDAEELESLYLALENGNIPELKWQNPGRRALSPPKKEEPTKPDPVEKETPTKNNNDFDFMDDVSVPQSTMRIRNINSTPKSAKKKTANFAGVIDQLKKSMQKD